MKYLITIIITIVATATFYEFSTDGIIKEQVVNPIYSETFHSYLDTDTGEVTHHKGYLPDIEWREENGLLFAYQKNSSNLLVGLNGTNDHGDQWFWEHVRYSRGGEDLIPNGYTMVDLRDNEIPPAIFLFAEGYNHESDRYERITVKALAKDEFVVRTPPVTLPKINW